MSEAGFGQTSSLFLTWSDASHESLLMHEFLMPYLSREAPSLMQSMTSENTRLPLFLLFIAITLFYQLYWKEGAVFNKPKKEDKD